MNKLIVGNLKMNLLSIDEREQYLNLFKRELKGKKLEKVDLLLAPPFVHLEGFKKAKIKNLSLGAQNMFWEKKGSFTGEISPSMLKNLGNDFVILGHSERRKYFQENDQTINLKVQIALKEGLRPILCVGETGEEKEANKTLTVIKREIKNALRNISRARAENIIIAYEPIWAIGAITTPTTNEIMEAKVLIKKILVELFGANYTNKIRILYGGSVSVTTIQATCLDSGMDGVLIGRESLRPYEFLKIAELVSGSS